MYKGFEEWRQHKELRIVPVAPTPSHLEEVQNGDIVLLKNKKQQSYQVIDDPRLVRVVAPKHKHRLALIIHSFSHLGLPSVLRVKFVDRIGYIKDAIVDECEIKRIN